MRKITDASRLSVISILLICCLCPPLVMGAPSLTEAQLNAEIDHLNSDNSLDAATRERLMQAYQDALDSLRAMKAEKARIGELKQLVASPDGALKQFQQGFASTQALIKEATEVAKKEEVDLLALESLRTRLAAEGAALRNQLAAIEDRLNALKDPGNLNQQLINSRNELAAIKSAGDQSAQGASTPKLAEALRTLDQLKRDAKSAEVERIELELSSLPLRLQLTQQEQTWLKSLYQSWEEANKALEARLQKQQKDNVDFVELKIKETAQEVPGTSTLLKRIADQNIQYVGAWRELLRREKETAQKSEQAKQQLDHLQQEEKQIKERIKQFGLSNLLAEILRQQRAGLPDIKTYEQRIEVHQRYMSDASLKQYQLQQAQVELKNKQNQIDALVDQIVLDSDDLTEPQVRKYLSRLFDQQAELLDRILAAYDAYLKDLSSLTLNENQLVQEARAYQAFLDEQLIWIPSTRPIDWQLPINLFNGIRYYLSPANGAALIDTLGKELIRSPLYGVILLFGSLVLWGLRKPLAFSVNEHRQRIGKRYSDRFSYSFESLLFGVVSALPLPFFIWFLGKVLSGSLYASNFAYGVGVALVAVSTPLFSLLLFLQLARPKGFFERHLQWSSSGLRSVRHHLWWFIPAYILVMFLVASSHVFSQRPGSAAVEQVTFMLQSLLLATLFFRLLSPNGHVAKPIFNRWPNGWFFRLRYVWYFLIVASPLILMLLAGLGYLYTAQYFLDRFEWTVWLFVGALVLYDLGRRGLALEQNKLALKVARQDLTENKAIGEDGTELSIENDPLDMDKIDLQSRQMLLTSISWGVIFGLWWIWSGSLPALNALDDVVLWQHNINVGGEMQVAPISLADLLLALITGFIISIASKNIPGVLEIMVLQHLPLTPGSRYAITTLVRYLIILIGALIIFGLVGLKWSQMQWLVAALGVGLGFGLQEIFANFVSGLIILFERPVRVGDAVTVADLSGVVSKIRMRATTITDWDRKEIIVPNKTFITEKLINWSLSDSVTRVKISVGIAYGSDTKKAYEIIQTVARRNKFVLTNPGPKLFFVGFGDSSLDFVLFVYVDNLDNRWNAAHEIHMEINEEFARAGIEIPFPQRDIHIRSIVNGVDLFGSDSAAKPADEKG
ncbi:MAG: mechanosensitive ion channel domain-containing protein [Thiotrichales bacterium]